MFTFLKTKEDNNRCFDRHIDPQTFDLLQLSKEERECREQFLALKQELHRPATHKQSYKRIDETILRRKAVNAAFYYRFVRRERMRLFRNYIDRLPTHSSVAT